MSDETGKGNGGGMQYPKHRFSRKQEFCMRAGQVQRAMRRERTENHKKQEGLAALRRYMGEEQR